MTRIVTSTYRYKRPPRKKKPALLEMPAVVQARRVEPIVRPDGSKVHSSSATAPPEAPASDDRRSAIVTAKRRRSRFGEVPDMTLEEHQRRGEAADALFREIVRRATE